eukprot:TRINITY_DN3290_c0_g1_i1.p1 TRINITY_DN3290_c0_g1~~TRINITY_DN3290_c0_g1_i1.p1  ORF type:complete len:343 (-),score=-25.80 TRINITY_DN3290_c0_g1_i1:596-1624(-)
MNMLLIKLNKENCDKLKDIGFRLVAGLLVMSVPLLFIAERLKRGYVVVNLLLVFVIIAYRIYRVFNVGHDAIYSKLIRAAGVYKGLVTEQKLYVNSAIIFLGWLFVYFVGGEYLAVEYFVFLKLFFVYVVLYDILRWYKAVSNTLLGKALIAIFFLAITNFSYSLAAQAVTEVLGVTPINFSRTIIFISIMMIPILMALLGGGVFLGGVAVSSFVIFLSLIKVPSNFNKWVFAGTLPISKIKHAGITRVFQLFFYGTVGIFLFQFGKNNLPWYEKKIIDAVSYYVFNFEMYKAKECQLGKDYRIAPLGDSKYLVAKKNSGNDILFLDPVKCDDLSPSNKLLR